MVETMNLKKQLATMEAEFRRAEITRLSVKKLRKHEVAVRSKRT